MKRSLAVLALLALSSASLCATENYNREKVLALFAQYNPSVLENAQQNGAYQSILESVAQSYNLPQTEENTYSLIALIRNFDNSLLLNALSEEYQRALFVNYANDVDTTAITERFVQDLTPVFSRIWAVSVQVFQLRLKDAKGQLKAVKKDKTLSDVERKETSAVLKQKISLLKQEISNLKKDSATQINGAVESFAAQAQAHVWQSLEQSRQASLAAQKNVAVKETKNLSITSKNKKPVAK